MSSFFSFVVKRSAVVPMWKMPSLFIVHVITSPSARTTLPLQGSYLLAVTLGDMSATMVGLDQPRTHCVASRPSAMVPEPISAPLPLGRRPKHVCHHPSLGVIRYKKLEKVTYFRYGYPPLALSRITL